MCFTQYEVTSAPLAVRIITRNPQTVAHMWSTHLWSSSKWVFDINCGMNNILLCVLHDISELSIARGLVLFYNIVIKLESNHLSTPFSQSLTSSLQGSI